MSGSVNTEIRAALRDEKRVGVAIASADTAGRSLKVLIGTTRIAKDAQPPGSEITPVAHAPERLENQRQPQPAHLTRRELQVLQLIARGLHNRQIADRIHRSIKTVEKHRQSLHTKLSTHEVAGLTRYALSIGLMDKTRQRRGGGLGKGARQLTPRELEVLKLVAQGSGNKWIASELHRSIKTVDHHRENIMKKLDIHEVAGLTRYAVFLGLM
jgi:DNA-binding NarL/FixJ family response regulator